MEGVIFVFDHSVDDSCLERHRDIDADWWDGARALTVDYLTRTFENVEIYRRLEAILVAMRSGGEVNTPGRQELIKKLIG